MGFNGSSSFDPSAVGAEDSTNRFVRRLCSIPVDLTVAAITDLYQVPSGINALLVSRAILEGSVSMAGLLRTSRLQVGTAANNYTELLGAGNVYSGSLANTLLQVGGALDLFATTAPNTAPKMRFSPGDKISAKVSTDTSLLTSGLVIVHLFGDIA